MDKALATYLFLSETIYSSTKAEPQKLTLPTSEPAYESTQVKEKPVTVRKEAPPETLIEAKPSQEKKEQKADIKEVKVYNMKTTHLFVFQQLSDSDREFLLKIVQALGLSFTKVDLLELKDYPFLSFKETIYTNKIQNILFFGKISNPKFVDRLKLKPYSLKEIKNINFLQVDDLKVISANKNNEKRKLWSILQGIFT